MGGTPSHKILEYITPPVHRTFSSSTPPKAPQLSLQTPSTCQQTPARSHHQKRYTGTGSSSNALHPQRGVGVEIPHLEQPRKTPAKPTMPTFPSMVPTRSQLNSAARQPRSGTGSASGRWKRSIQVLPADRRITDYFLFTGLINGSVTHADHINSAINAVAAPFLDPALHSDSSRGSVRSYLIAA